MQFDIRHRYESIPTGRDFVPYYGTQHPSARLSYYIPRILSLSKDTNGFIGTPRNIVKKRIN
jgi:hypothetical protein